MTLVALLDGARHVTVIGGSYPPHYKARPMDTSKGTRGGGPALTGLKVGEESWPPDVHVHVKTIPRWLVWTTALGILALLGVGVWIGVELHDIRAIESNRSGYQQETHDVLCEIRRLLGGK